MAKKSKQVPNMLEGKNPFPKGHKWHEKFKLLQQQKNGGKSGGKTEENTNKESSKDDLTEIKGIGAKLEEQLNGLGIYTFYQLANLNEEALEEIEGIIKGFTAKFEKGFKKEAAAFSIGKNV